VDLGTHCNTGLNRVCCPLASDIDPNILPDAQTMHPLKAIPIGLQLILLIYSFQFRSAFHLLMLSCCASTAVITEIGVFQGIIALKLYVPHQISYTKGTSLGCRLAPKNDSHHSKLCCLSCTRQTSTHFKLFVGMENPQHRNSEIFHRCMHTHTDLHLLFQRWSKLVQDKWSKATCIGEKKTLFGTLRQFPIFCVCANRGLSLIFQVSRSVRFGSYNQKTLPRPSEKMQYRLFECIIITEPGHLSLH